MATSAIIEDGKITNMTTETTKTSTTNNGMDKDAFLQLLVAQMKYQDPLEPTSNTEYISQYATFSQVEQMQNMSASMELSRASAYVGQTVVLHTTNTSGNTVETTGKVDYVIYENNKAYLSVNGTMYSADDVYATIDQTYQTATELATAFNKAMDALPEIENLTIDHEESVKTLQEGYNAMTAYQQSFISTTYVEKLQKYVEQMAAIKKTAEGETDTTTTA